MSFIAIEPIRLWGEYKLALTDCETIFFEVNLFVSDGV